MDLRQKANTLETVLFYIILYFIVFFLIVEKHDIRYKSP